MAVPRKKNIAGYIDEVGRFRPIRKPSFVGTPKRRATPKDRKKYSRAKAGDLGVSAQEKATGVDFFAKEARKEKQAWDRTRKRIDRETLGEADELDSGRTLVEFVRDKGGIRPTYKFGGKANRGKKISYDAGELAPLTYKESGKRGLVSEKGKLTLDGMHQAAREAGYDIGDINDLINRLDDEIRGGKSTYATRGYIDYRDNPKRRRNGVLVGDRKSKSDLYVTQLGPRSFGVFLKTYLLKKFSTKAAADSHVRSIQTKAKKNPINIFGVVAAVSGVQSALQINEMLKKKKPVRRKARVKVNPSGKTMAKRKNPHGDMPSGARFNEKLFDQDLAAIEDGNFRLIRSAKAHGKLAGYKTPEIDRLVQRARLAFQLKEMYRRKENPTDVAKLLAPIKANGAFKRMLQRRKAASALKRELKLEAALEKTRAKKKRAIAAATNPIKVKLYKFYPGQRVISSSYFGDHTMHDYGVILKRTAKTVTYKDDLHGGPYTRKVRVFGDSETFSRKPSTPNFYAKDNQPKGNPKSNPAFYVVQDPASKKWYVVNREGVKVRDWHTRKFKEFATSSGAVAMLRKWQKEDPLIDFALVKNPSRSAAGKKAVTRSAKTNPAKKPPRSRTFERFQGRPVTNAVKRPISRHAPAKVAQLGDLIEIKLVGMTPIKLNPSKAKLTAANGRLWIAGQRFAKPSASAKPNELNPIGEIDHVVYGTHKPHHGDHAYTHYIHKLGEESGKRPLLCVDKEGFAVIRGGNYKIEARGIVD